MNDSYPVAKNKFKFKNITGSFKRPKNVNKWGLRTKENPLRDGFTHMFKHRPEQMEDYFNDGLSNLSSMKSSLTRKNVNNHMTRTYNHSVQRGGDDDFYQINPTGNNKMVYPDDSAS